MSTDYSPLKTGLRGELIQPADAGYDEARKLYNAMIDKKPAAIGTVVGIFSGLWGLLFMPLVGAAIGEYPAQRDVRRAGKAGIATWIGLLFGTAAKLAIVLTMIGIFVFALVV
jgi:uncharacterized protein YqgC (DUF456 family)